MPGPLFLWQSLQVNEAFDLFDADKDGRLDYHQLKVRTQSKSPAWFHFDET